MVSQEASPLCLLNQRLSGSIDRPRVLFVDFVLDGLSNDALQIVFPVHCNIAVVAHSLNPAAGRKSALVNLLPCSKVEAALAFVQEQVTLGTER